MAGKAVFCHARYPVCADAGQAGVTSVRTLAVAGSVYHINHGADLSALR